MKLEALKPVHINWLYAELAEKGFSAKSVWCVHLLLRRILDAACKDGLLDVNPADFCKVSDAEKKSPFRLRQSQLRRYLDAASMAGVLPVISCALTLCTKQASTESKYIGLTVGLRQCELFTLPWADFNLERRYILRGKRPLTLSDRAVALLEAEYARHPDSPYAFLNPKTGAPYRLHEFYYLHRKLSAQARLPKLGDVPLNELTEARIGGFLDERKRNGGSRPECPDYPGLSDVTMRHIHRLLKECLDRAVEAGLMANNSARAFRYDTQRKAKVTALSENEIGAYLDAAEELGHLPMFTLMLTAGLRQRELLTLKWSDFDETRGVLTVSEGRSLDTPAPR